MKLTQHTIKLIKNWKVRLQLCAVLDVTDQTIGDYIKKNKPNGPLTTFSALKVIREATGLSDSEILEEVEAEAGIAA